MYFCSILEGSYGNEHIASEEELQGGNQPADKQKNSSFVPLSKITGGGQKVGRLAKERKGASDAEPKRDDPVDDADGAQDSEQDCDDEPAFDARTGVHNDYDIEQSEGNG